MASRESIGIAVMTLVFVLLMGTIGGYVYVNHVAKSPARPGDADAPFDARTAEWYVARAKENAARGDFYTALDDYSSAINLDPDSLDALRGRADAYARVDEHGAAIADYTAVIDRGEGPVEILIGRASSREALGELTAAIADFEEIARRMPESIETLRSLGRLRKATGDFDGAIAALRRAIELGVDTRSEARLHTELAWAQWGAGDYDGALMSYDEAIGAESNRLHDHFGRGVCLLYLDRLDEARTSLTRATRAGGRQTGHDYAHYYLWIATARQLGRSAAEETLRSYVESTNEMEIGAWSPVIASFLLGDIDETRFLEEAAAGGWQSTEEQLCEACWYAGAVRLLDGDTETAADLFRRGFEIGHSNFYEHYSSQHALRQLDVPLVGDAK